jgi:hypothetical protein
VSESMFSEWKDRRFPCIHLSANLPRSTRVQAEEGTYKLGHRTLERLSFEDFCPASIGMMPASFSGPPEISTCNIPSPDCDI